MTIGESRPPAGTLGPDDWGNWDVHHHVASVHPGTGLRIRPAIGCPDGQVVDGFTWRRGMVDVGMRTADGSFAAFTVGCDCGATLALEFGRGDQGVLAMSMSLHDGDGDPHDLVVIVDSLPGDDRASVDHATGRVDQLGLDLAAQRWTIELSVPGTVTSTADATSIRITGEQTGEVLLTCSSGAAAPELADLRARATEAELHSSGWLGDSAAGYARVLTWNAIRVPELGRVITPCSRDFVSADRDGFYGTWALHAWDSLFAGLTAAWIEPAYARSTFGQIFEQATPAGFLPNRVSDERGRTDDRSQPPIGGYTALKAFLGSGLSNETRDRRLIDDEVYATLSRWHEWWRRARRGPHGLLAWGSDPTDDPTSASVDNTRRESGLDDSPMYDDVEYDPTTHTMNLADVGLNALHAADAEALAVIADIRGDHRDADRLRQRLAADRTAVDRILWDEQRGHHANRLADGTFSIHVAPTMLYPLLAGIPSPERATQLVDALMRPDTIGGSPPLPSIARNDPGFTRHYCRGRLWGPVALLAYEGFRRYGFDDWCRRIAHELVPLFRHEWERHRHVHENWPLSLEEDIHSASERSDFLHTFGNLMAYVPMLELADPRVDGWRFAHPEVDAELSRIRLTEGLLSISASDRLVVCLDERVLIDAEPSVVVAGFERSSSIVRASLRAADGSPATARIGVPASVRQAVRVTFGDEKYEATVPDDGLLEFVLPDGNRQELHIESR